MQFQEDYFITNWTDVPVRTVFGQVIPGGYSSKTFKVDMFTDDAEQDTLFHVLKGLKVWFNLVQLMYKSSTCCLSDFILLFLGPGAARAVATLEVDFRTGTSDWVLWRMAQAPGADLMFDDLSKKLAFNMFQLNFKRVLRKSGMNDDERMVRLCFFIALVQGPRACWSSVPQRY